MATATAERREKTYEQGVKYGEQKAKREKGNGKGLISSLLNDLFELIDNSDGERKKQLTAQTKTPTRETVVAAFDAANDVTAGAQAAYEAKQAGNLELAIQLQRQAEAEFLTQDALVREGALLVLYIRAEAEYQAGQEAAGYIRQQDLDLAA